MSTTPETVNIIVANGEEVKGVNLAVIRMSAVVQRMIETIGATGDDIHLPGVANAALLAKVLEYCTHHYTDVAPEPSAEADDRIKDVLPWDTNFFAPFDCHFNVALVKVSNFLEVPGLTDLLCTKIAIQIANKTPEEIRKMFNLAEELTPEEQAFLKREEEWLKAL